MLFCWAFKEELGNTRNCIAHPKPTIADAKGRILVGFALYRQLDAFAVGLVDRHPGSFLPAIIGFVLFIVIVGGQSILTLRFQETNGVTRMPSHMHGAGPDKETSTKNNVKSIIPFHADGSNSALKTGADTTGP